MKIPLNQFEMFIDEKILKRGLDYFKQGAVTDFSEISSGGYEAIVSGTEEYTVQLEIKNNTLIECHCDCPYDWGTLCKHVVAVIFYLQQHELEINQPDFLNPKKEKTKNINQQIKDLLKEIPHNELVDFIVENSKKDKVFRNYFLASFGHLSQNQSKEFYQKQIHSILKTAAGSDGWISYSDMKYVVNTIQSFLENAEKYLANQNYENVFFISTALLEEMAEALEYTDDSNGHLGEFIASAIEMLSELTKKNISDTLKKEIFDYCISIFQMRLFEGWDWHFDILHIADDLVENELEADKILSCLENVNGEYEKEYAQSYQLGLLEKYKGSKEVEAFVRKHLSNSRIRKQEIEKAFENKNFDKAIELAKDGIVCDEQNKPGLAKDWYDWLLKIALVQKDTPSIIRYARYRLIHNFGGTQNYYLILKNNIEPENWHPFLEEVIKEVMSANSWANKGLIRKIYIEEEWWDKLFLMLKQNATLESIEENEQYLAKDYATELIALYSERITDYIQNSVGRSNYQTACRYLLRMKKLGGNLQVNQLVKLFRQKYPKRKALMEELNKI